MLPKERLNFNPQTHIRNYSYPLQLPLKKKLDQYLIGLEGELRSNQVYVDLIPKVGNVGKDYQSIWGVLCKQPLERIVHIPHFNFTLDSSGFQIGVQIEGKTPTAKMERNIRDNKGEFLEILRKLDGFNLVIRTRWNVDNRPRKFQSETATTIKLGKNEQTKSDNITIQDVNYISEKLNQLTLFEIYCGFSYDCDNKILENKNFLKVSSKIMEKLKEYYNFSQRH